MIRKFSEIQSVNWTGFVSVDEKQVFTEKQKAIALANLGIGSEPGPGPEPTPGPTWDETTIGDSTWAAENLAYDDDGEGILIVPNVTVNGVNFGTQYYYRSDAAMRIYKNWSNLPFSGWRIATQDDGMLLQSSVSNDPLSLMTTSGWNDGMNGNNLNGFNGAPIGYYWDNEGTPELIDLGSQCTFWLYADGSEEFNDDFDNYMYFGPENISHEGFDVNKWWFPIRLVKE